MLGRWISLLFYSLYFCDFSAHLFDDRDLDRNRFERDDFYNFWHFHVCALLWISILHSCQMHFSAQNFVGSSIQFGCFFKTYKVSKIIFDNLNHYFANWCMGLNILDLWNQENLLWGWRPSSRYYYKNFPVLCFISVVTIWNSNL